MLLDESDMTFSRQTHGIVIAVAILVAASETIFGFGQVQR